MKTHRFYENPSIIQTPTAITHRFYRPPLRSNPSRGVHHPLIGKLRHGKEGGGKAGKIYHGVGQIHHGGGHGARGSHTPRGVEGRQLVCPRLATWPSRLTAGQGGRSLSGNLAKKFNPSTPRTILGRCSANVCHLRPLQTTPA